MITIVKKKNTLYSNTNLINIHIDLPIKWSKINTEFNNLFKSLTFYILFLN